MPLDPIVVTPLRQIDTSGGAVYHGIKTTEAGYAGFGEAYFSTINKGSVKGWKRHRLMTLNLIVPLGSVQIGAASDLGEPIRYYFLSAVCRDNYRRLSVPPGWWIAFGGLADHNIMLNVANILHDPSEAENLPIDRLGWDWQA